MTDSSSAAIVYMLYILRNTGVVLEENRSSSNFVVAQLVRISLFFRPALVQVLVVSLVLVLLPVPAVPAADVDRVVGAAADAVVVVAIAVEVAIEYLGSFFGVVAGAVAVVVIDLVFVAIVVVVVAIALV